MLFPRYLPYSRSHTYLPDVRESCAVGRVLSTDTYLSGLRNSVSKRREPTQREFQGYLRGSPWMPAPPPHGTPIHSRGGNHTLTAVLSGI